MALPINIKTLLSGNVVEWARIEFKESWNPDASLKTITAFANDIDNWSGGYLIIGVKDDNGRPEFPLKGVPAEEIDDILKDLLNKCKLITPDYLPVVAPVDYDENTKYATIEQRNYFKVGDKVNIFGPNKIDFDFEVQEILNEKNEKIDVARHPKEILKIKIPHKVVKDSMIRVQI